MMNENFIKKVLPIILTINCFYIWVMIIIGTIQLFGNGLLGIIICVIPLILNVYIHIRAYMNIKDDYNIKDQD